MKTLNKQQIKYGFTHNSIVNNIKCTKDKKRILNEWIDFLTHNPSFFTELRLGTKVPQNLFNAICEQKI